jgi:hypothetical protein
VLVFDESVGEIEGYSLPVHLEGFPHAYTHYDKYFGQLIGLLQLPRHEDFKALAFYIGDVCIKGQF